MSKSAPSGAKMQDVCAFFPLPFKMLLQATDIQALWRVNGLKSWADFKNKGALSDKRNI